MLRDRGCALPLGLTRLAMALGVGMALVLPLALTAAGLARSVLAAPLGALSAWPLGFGARVMRLLALAGTPDLVEGGLGLCRFLGLGGLFRDQALDGRSRLCRHGRRGLFGDFTFNRRRRGGGRLAGAIILAVAGAARRGRLAAFRGPPGDARANEIG